LVAAALGNIAWAQQFAQAARWARASFGDPAPVNLAKQDDLPG
jgi:hypothetical protein